MKLASGPRARLQQALGPAPRAPRASQHVSLCDPGAQAKTAMTGTSGRHRDRRPIRRALQATGKSLHGLLSSGRQLAVARPAAQGWLRGDDVQFADLGQQVGDPLECCPEPEHLLRGKK